MNKVALLLVLLLTLQIVFCQIDFENALSSPNIPAKWKTLLINDSKWSLLKTITFQSGKVAIYNDGNPMNLFYKYSDSAVHISLSNGAQLCTKCNIS